MALLRSKRFWVGLVITIVTLVLAFRGIQLNEMAHAFSQFNLAWLPLAILVFWVSYGGRASRWQLLFYPYHLRWSKVLGTLSIGYFLSNITPLRIGDLVRAYLIGEIEHVPIPRALSTVVVERTSDGLTIVLFLLAMIPLIPKIPEEARSAGAVLGVVGVALLVVLALVSLQKERGIAFLKRITVRMALLRNERIWQALGNLIDGFAVLRSPRALLGVAAWSLEIWVTAVILTWVMMLAMGLNLPITAAVLVQVLTALAVTVAPSPGQFGIFHLTTQFTLNSVYGVDPAQALAYAFVIHGFVYLWTTGLGIFYIWREGLSMGRLQTLKAEG